MRNHWTILRKGKKEPKSYFRKDDSDRKGWGLGVESRDMGLSRQHSG